VFRGVVLGVVACAVVVAPLLLFVSAPYGRHRRPGWGPTLPSRWAWVLMESPSALLFPVMFFAGTHALSPVPLVLATLWMLHYGYRTFVYPLRTYRDDPRREPLVIVASGFTFNVCNAWMNAVWISELGPRPPTDLLAPSFVLGACLFVVAHLGNRWADGVLRRLRTQGGGYRIPRGGLYEWISCPNYFTETVQWLAFAAAAWSPAGLAFAAFTAANLWPRAIAHHRWYHRTFPDYPARRRAVIPWLL
jgi:hypothetical protein